MSKIAKWTLNTTQKQQLTPRREPDSSTDFEAQVKR